MNDFELQCNLNPMPVFKNTIQYMTLGEIKAFLREFGEDDNVKLEAKTYKKVAELMGYPVKCN